MPAVIRSLAAQVDASHPWSATVSAGRWGRDSGG
jgi:hypothetical protein